MAKNKDYNTVLGDAFKKAFDKSADGKPTEKFPEAPNSPIPTKKHPTAVQPSPEIIKRSPPRPVENRNQFAKLFYNASKRLPEEIKTDFYDRSASLSKKKGILEGVCSIYYALVRAGSREKDSVARLIEYQCLKDEFENYFRDVKNGKNSQRKTEQSCELKKISKKLDSAPITVQQTRKMFSSTTQFLEDGSDLQEVYVVIGLDFGTSCTKVVIGTPYEQERAFLVPFKGIAHNSNSYLLPTHISIEQGHYYLPKTAERGQFADLKLKLIKTFASPDDECYLEHAVAYLSLVFRYARTWFLESYKTVFGERKVVWLANVGVPSATFECDDLTEIYRKAVLTAWLVSVQEGDVTRKLVSEVTESLHSGKQSADLSLDLEVFPEVAAEVAGYARSEHRREGLHLMVDVGAGTMDVCGFILHRDNGVDKYPLLSSSVKLLGALQLDRTRRDAVATAVSNCHQELMSDGISPICNDLGAYIPDIDSIGNQIKTAQNGFSKACKIHVRSVVKHLRQSMDPHADAWDNGMPIFLCGGGSAISLYKELVDDLSDWLRKNTTARGVARHIPLEKPEKLEGDINVEDFHRFAVAWGLSWPSWEIGEIITNFKPVISPTTNGGGSGWWDRPPDYSTDDL